MNKAMTEWQEAERRANEARARIDDLNAAQLPVTDEMLAELASLENEVLTKLRAVYRSEGQGDAMD